MKSGPNALSGKNTFVAVSRKSTNREKEKRKTDGNNLDVGKRLHAVGNFLKYKTPGFCSKRNGSITQYTLGMNRTIQYPQMSSTPDYRWVPQKTTDVGYKDSCENVCQLEKTKKHSSHYASSAVVHF